MNTHAEKILNRDLHDYCLGTMYFGSKVDRKTSFRLLDIYAGQGGCLLDSANKYASWIPGFVGGESEEVIGAWLKSKSRADYVVTSKVGFPYGDIPQSLAAKYIISECEKSLKRLGTDYLDIYFAHSQDVNTPIEESLAAFDTLIKQGKVRCLGASNYDVWRLAEAHCVAEQNSLPVYGVLQQRHTLLKPTVGADFGTQKILTPEHLDFCQAKEVLVMAYSPLLAGLYEKSEPEFPVQYQAEINRKIFALLQQTASESGYTPSQLILGWMLYASPSIVPLVTASKPEHLEQNLIKPDPKIIAQFAEQLDNLDRFTIKYS